MFNILLRTYCLTVFFIVLTSLSCKGQTNPHTINGIWLDSNSNAFSEGYAIFSVDDQGLVIMTHYVEFKGTPMVEKGNGTCRHDTLTYDVVVTQAIPGWSLSGRHVLVLSPDGQTLRGYYKDAKGNTGPLVFKRLKSHPPKSKRPVK